MARRGLEAMVSSSTSVVGYCLEAPVGIVSVSIAFLTRGPGVVGDGVCCVDCCQICLFSTKETVRVDYLKHSPRSRQVSYGDLQVGEYLVDRT